MKKTVCTLFTLTIVFGLMIILIPLQAKKCMPTLDRLRKKVDQTLDQRTSTNRSTVQELLHASVPVSSNSSDSKVVSVICQLASLYWANQIDFVKALQETKTQSAKQALVLLRDKLLTTFSEEKLPLITFAHELKKELETIQQNTTILFSCINKKSTDAQSPETSVQEGFEKITQLKNNLALLMNLVNDLCLSDCSS